MPASSTPTAPTFNGNDTSGDSRKRRRSSVDLTMTTLETVQLHIAACVALLTAESVAEDDLDFLHLLSYSDKLLMVKAAQREGFDVMAIPFSSLKIEHLPRLNITYDKAVIKSVQTFRDSIIDAIPTAFYGLNIDLERWIRNFRDKNEAGRRFYVNQAVWDVMDYCEVVKAGQEFCVLPELVLARSSKASSKASSETSTTATNKATNKTPRKSKQKEVGKKVNKKLDQEADKEEADQEADKEAGKFGLSIKGTTTAENSSEIVKCYTFLTGVADYALWNLGRDPADRLISMAHSMKILFRPQNDDATGQIVTVESKRQLSTPGEIDAAIAQAAGECLVMEASVPFVVTSGLKWIFGVLHRTGEAQESGASYALWHSEVLELSPGSREEGDDVAYRAVFESLFFWIAGSADDIQRIFNRQPAI
ncbi:hypothetical protein HWV62_17182 [Athelia sp. TMB]|nr:hypothetical protein HWV62_17182 [Athelia sp. TMB]